MTIKIEPVKEVQLNSNYFATLSRGEKTSSPLLTPSCSFINRLIHWVKRTKTEKKKHQCIISSSYLASSPFNAFSIFVTFLLQHKEFLNSILILSVQDTQLRKKLKQIQHETQFISRVVYDTVGNSRCIFRNIPEVMIAIKCTEKRILVILNSYIRACSLY